MEFLIVVLPALEDGPSDKRLLSGIPDNTAGRDRPALAVHQRSAQRM
jgi:hypothetical protein